MNSNRIREYIDKINSHLWTVSYCYFGGSAEEWASYNCSKSSAIEEILKQMKVELEMEEIISGGKNE